MYQALPSTDYVATNLYLYLQTFDGRPVDFHVKKVHQDTLGWRAGVKANDRIVQVMIGHHV